MRSGQARAGVQRHALVGDKAFEGLRRESHLDLTFDQRGGDGIEMALHFNVVVNADTRLAPFGIFVSGGRQGLQDGLVERHKL